MEELLRQYSEIAKQLQYDANRLASLRPNNSGSSLDVVYVMNDITNELQTLTLLMQEISIRTYLS